MVVVAVALPKVVVLNVKPQPSAGYASYLFAPYVTSIVSTYMMVLAYSSTSVIG